MGRSRDGSTRHLAKRVLLITAVAYFVQCDGTVCPESQTSCSVRCLDREGATFDKPRESCRCDPQCILYDDCCEDYWINCVSTSPDIRLHQILRSQYSDYLGCVSPIDVNSFYNNFMVVSRCPPSWKEDAIKSRCENITLSRQEKVLTMFVNGPGDIVFKNVFCALCHGNEEHELRSWSVELWNCQPAAGETLLVVQGGKPDYDTCTEFRVQPPASMPYDPHRCYPGVIDTCPSNTTAPVEQIQLCENHTSLLFHRDMDIVYKNVHCFNCSRRSVGSVDIEDLRCKVSKGQNHRFEPALSFTLLFDLRLRTVHSVKNQGFFHRTSSSPQLLTNCSRWQLYDPFQGVCRDLVCTDGQALDEASGSCSTEQVKGTLPRRPKPSDDCLTDFISANNDEISESNASLWKFQDIEKADSSDKRRRTMIIFTNFARAGHIQSSLDLILSNVTDPVDLACNASSVVLVASNQPQTKEICQGFILDNISFADLFFLDGAFSVNISGFIYDQHEFMHVTEYFLEVGKAIVSKREWVTLCNPLAGSPGCSLITLYPEDFYRCTDGGTIIQTDSGLLFTAGSYWLLPDGTARVCRVEWSHTLAYVSYIGTLCSVVGLVLTFLTYSTFPSLRNTPGKIIMNLMGALLVSQLFLMFVARDPQSWLCELRGAMLHFSWLAVFSWMSVFACDLAYNLKSNLRPAQQARQGGLNDWKVAKLSIFAWGLPTVTVLFCFVASRVGENNTELFQYGGGNCWIVGLVQLYVVFGLPVLLAIMVNFAVFLYMIYTLIANHRRLAAARVGQESIKTTIVLCFKVGIVTGVTWTFFIVANIVFEPAIWYISVIFGSLHGAFVSLIFLLRDNVSKLWWEKLAQMREAYRTCICHHLGSRKPSVPQGDVSVELDARPSDPNTPSSCDTLSTSPSENMT